MSCEGQGPSGAHAQPTQDRPPSSKLMLGVVMLNAFDTYVQWQWSYVLAPLKVDLRCCLDVCDVTL
jgi:hypothetical protein